MFWVFLKNVMPKSSSGLEYLSYLRQCLLSELRKGSSAFCYSQVDHLITWSLACYARSSAGFRVEYFSILPTNEDTAFYIHFHTGFSSWEGRGARSPIGSDGFTHRPNRPGPRAFESPRNFFLWRLINNLKFATITTLLLSSQKHNFTIYLETSENRNF